MAGEINGVALASISFGAIFVYGGIVGKSPLSAIQAVILGQSPQTVSKTQTITGDTSAATAGTPATANDPGSGMQTTISGGDAQTVFHQTAIRFGWGSGPEWDALQNIEMNEAGYSTTAANPKSGALGIAQALGHDHGAATQGTLGNQYGGYGLSDAQAKAANSGDAGAQSLWMMNYIKSRYGDPIAAWAQYHHADGNNWY